ncbi:MAG: phosphatase PAP2 family protein, partial [Thermoanaerobaculia bacterium]|nr:phosphatase PAP2 family protein [Thermoanaerobaculia bacterium]
MEPFGERFRRRPWWPRPFELVTVAASLGTLGYLRARGLDYGWNTVRHSFPSLLGLLPVLLVQGVVLQAVATRLVGAPMRGYFDALRQAGWWSLWARLWIVSSIQAYTYMWLKVSVPLLRAELYDVELWHLDRWLHFGLSPTVFAIELVAGTPLAAVVDRLYAWWVPSVPLILSFAYAAARADRRRNLALAGTVLWIGGAWLYLAWPAVGPCYASPDVLAPIREAMPNAMGAQAGLWHNYLTMVRSRGALLESFSPLFGVAAMPSLHVAAYAMFTFWSRRHARRWFWPFV